MALASTILMVRPAAFGFNPETAEDNYFQTPSTKDQQTLQQNVLAEFDSMVNMLKEQGIGVIVIEDTPEPVKPSAVFPNNWLSTSPEGIVSVFPMYAPNRRVEKRYDIIKMLADKFVVKDFHDWTEFEAEGKFLEGTGSMVIDHDNKVIYACYSPRTDIAVLEKFANANGYRAIVFLATDNNGHAVYHTNVVMCIGEGFAVLCEESIEEEWELIAVRQLLETTGHEIIAITREQMRAFAGNMLQVKNKEEERILLLSQTAYDALGEEQEEKLSLYARLLPVAIPTIEKTEGGSVRCMIAEVFLKRK